MEYTIEPIDEPEVKTLTVGEYIDLLNERLKGSYATIKGEISEVSQGGKGHRYISLQDKDGNILKCAIWQSIYQRFGLDLKIGMEIIATGVSDVYPLKGTLTFKISSYHLAGEGLLKKQYDELKKKLESTGIFELGRKRRIPEYPTKIGIITSKTGDVIHDFMNNIGRYGFKITLVDSRVEGAQAVNELMGAIQTMEKVPLDVLVIMRGGGSLESFIPFNNEVLIRKISSFPVPVIIAVGHHKNVPLACLAADLSVSTPSIAANEMNKYWDKLAANILTTERSIVSEYGHAISESNSRIDQISRKIESKFASILQMFRTAEQKIMAAWDLIARIMTYYHKSLDAGFNAIQNKYPTRLAMASNAFAQQWKNISRDLESALPSIRDRLPKIFIGLRRALRREIADFSKALASAERVIRDNNPERQLKLGYAILRSGDSLVRGVSDIMKGSMINIQLKDGTVDSEVKQITKK
jgi:exodeoxyribonuclease VII large subunit